MNRIGAVVVAQVAALIATLAAQAQPAERIDLGAFSIDATEVTIAAFERHATASKIVTKAERDGGGFEFVGGWVRRKGWTFRTPSGAPGRPDDPAAHVSWNEARDYCAAVGGRLPTAAEWREAAYTERRRTPTDGFVLGRTYPYPVGATSEGMNTTAGDRWERQAPVGETRRGVNGLYDMGGNVWEWLADRRGDEALTAGGSWWYDAGKTKSDAMQWKAADFYAVYVGFRCAYGPAS
jgi:formylglycine-generating enzyme required for sulfatase activity